MTRIVQARNDLLTSFDPGAHFFKAEVELLCRLFLNNRDKFGYQYTALYRYKEFENARGSPTIWFSEISPITFKYTLYYIHKE